MYFKICINNSSGYKCCHFHTLNKWAIFRMILQSNGEIWGPTNSGTHTAHANSVHSCFGRFSLGYGGEERNFPLPSKFLLAALIIKLT